MDAWQCRSKSMLSKLHECAGSLLPSAHPEAFDQRRCSADYYVQQNIRVVENWLNIGWCILPNVQQFVSGETDCRNITKDRTN